MEKERSRLCAFGSPAGVHHVTAAAVIEQIITGMEGLPAEQTAPVIELARNLPAYSGNIMEFHFERAHAPFDFAFRINQQYDAPLFTPEIPLHNMTPVMRQGYNRLFNKSVAGFRYGIQHTWLEYDFPFKTIPAIFFDMHRDKAFHPEIAYAELKIITGDFQYPVDETLSGFLARIKHAGLKVVYYGLMFSRKPEAIRLTIEGIQAVQLTEIIKHLGWKGDRGALMALQKDYLGGDQKIVLAVDFEKRLRSRIGIEVHDINGMAFLEQLSRNGICSKKQGEFLKNWEGKTDLDDDFAMALTEVHQRSVNCIYRRINHFKFILETNRIFFKAYLYYCF